MKLDNPLWGMEFTSQILRDVTIGQIKKDLTRKPLDQIYNNRDILEEGVVNALEKYCTMYGLEILQIQISDFEIKII